MCERDAEARGDIGRKMEKTAIGKMVVGLKIFNLKQHDLSLDVQNYFCSYFITEGS